MQKLLGLIAALCLLSGTLFQIALAEESSHGGSGGYRGSDAYFRREIDAAGRRALARSALQRRRGQRSAPRRRGGTGFFARMEREDREQGYFRMGRPQPQASPSRKSTLAGTPRRGQGSRSAPRPAAARPFQPPVSDRKYHPPVSDGDYHPPVSDGAFQAPTTGH